MNRLRDFDNALFVEQLLYERSTKTFIESKMLLNFVVPAIELQNLLACNMALHQLQKEMLVKENAFKCILDSLNNLKSCLFPFVKFVHMTCFVFLSTIIWVFNVCLFFLPE